MSGHQAPYRKTDRPASTYAKRIPFSRSLSSAALLLLVLVLAGSLLLAGCGSEATESTDTTVEVTTTAASAEETTTAAATADFPVTVTDDFDNTVTIEAAPQRIVSTSPSVTEILFALELGDRIVGVSSLDDYPPEAADKEKVGDFQINTEAVIALSPDLVVGYTGAQEALKPVQDGGTPVIITNPTTLDGIYANILSIGAATGTNDEAVALIDSIQTKIEEVSAAAEATGQSPKVFYAVDNTLWTVGPGSFVDNLLTLTHATNVAATSGDGAAVDPYYQFAPEQLIAADPDLIMVPNTAYKSVDEFTGDARFASLRAVKEGRVYLVDDVVITRPGPRIADGLETLVKLIHPDALQ